MPSQAEVKWSQLKVGLIVLVSLALLSTLLFLISSATGLSVFSKQLTVSSYFSNSAGLKVGAPVDLEGVAVGEVKRIDIVTDTAHRPTPVRVTLKLNPKFQASLRTDTTASLSTVGVLGDTVVDLNSKTATGPQVVDGGILASSEQPSIQDVVKSSQGSLQNLNLILTKLNKVVDTIQSGQGSIGQLISNPALYNKATATVDQLNALAGNLNNGRGSAGKLLHDNELYDHLNDAAAKLDSIASNLNGGKGSAGKLLTDDTLVNNLNATLNNTNALLTGINNGQGSLGLLIKDPAFANKLNDTVGRLDTLLTGINNGQGTLGKFATDQAAYDNLNKLLTESTALVTTIRQDPKKYLTIHLKIF